MVAPIADVEENMYALNLHRGIMRSGIKAGLIYDHETFSHILIPASGNLFVEITPTFDAVGNKPLMVYTDHGANTESQAEIELAQICSYQYQARFTVKYDETTHVNRSPKAVAAQVRENGVRLGVIDHKAENFEEFIRGALYKINRDLNIEIYPIPRATKN